MQMTSADVYAQIPRGVRLVLTALGVVGLAGLLLTFWLGFEQGNAVLMTLSAAMVFSAPAAAVIHLACTRTLNRERKQIWWSEFGSADIWSALSEYLSSQDLGASADRRALEAEARRGVP